MASLGTQGPGPDLLDGVFPPLPGPDFSGAVSCRVVGDQVARMQHHTQGLTGLRFLFSVGPLAPLPRELKDFIPYLDVYESLVGIHGTESLHNLAYHGSRQEETLQC